MAAHAMDFAEFRLSWELTADGVHAVKDVSTQRLDDAPIERSGRLLLTGSEGLVSRRRHGLAWGPRQCARTGSPGCHQPLSRSCARSRFLASAAKRIHACRAPWTRRKACRRRTQAR